MALESRAKWGELIPDTGLRISDFFDQGDMLYTPGITALLNVVPGLGAQENFTGKTGFGRAIQFDDGADVPTLSRDKSYLTSVIWKNYGGSVEITKNNIEDQDFSQQLDAMKDLSRSINFSVDESGMQIFNGGFATTVTVNGYDITWYNDGNPTFSTVHATPVPGASTQSNASATGIKLGHDNLETAKIALALQHTDNGLPLHFGQQLTIVIPLNLEKEAKETIMSELTPESANNAINVFKGSVSVVSSIFLDAVNNGSDTQWFLIDRAMSQLYHGVRQEKRLNSEVNVKNMITTFVVEARWRNYVKDWRGVWGSKGDNQTYSS